jgi:pyruvate dehydrogenase E1 component beta subunit
MVSAERVLDNLNGALHTLLADDPSLYLLGEDVLDPYGGAFKVTAGLSTKHPDQVLATPISENGIVGVANGLALTGNRAIVEIMFGDFATLCFDQILNVAAKSVSMYGRRLRVPVVVRCPMGGNRGYGPTHSQSLQKHFIGIPDLRLCELSPWHDSLPVLRRMLDDGRPGMFFESKPVYAERSVTAGPIDDLFGLEHAGPDGTWARARSVVGTGRCLLIVPGGVAARALAAARTLLMEDEIDVTVLVASQLHPLEPGPVLADVAQAEHVFVAEESTPGGTWGAEVSYRLTEKCWTDLRHPVGVISSADAVVPAARHLERRVVLQTQDIIDRIREQVTSCTA